MKRALAACLFFAIVLLVSMPVRAAFVLYFHTFGDWSVSCWRDPFSGDNFCSLGAPQPALNAAAKRWQMGLSEERDGTVIWANKAGEPGDQVSLRVDDNPAHPAQIDVNGKASWRGAEALDLIDEFASGSTIRLSSFPIGGMSPLVTAFSLENFLDALSVYQAKLLTYGVNLLHDQ
jgi:hypothetical protein